MSRAGEHERLKADADSLRAALESIEKRLGELD